MLPEFLEARAQQDEDPFSRGLGLWADERLIQEAHDDTRLLGLLITRERIYADQRGGVEDRLVRLLASVGVKIDERKQELGITADPGQ